MVTKTAAHCQLCGGFGGVHDELCERLQPPTDTESTREPRNIIENVNQPTANTAAVEMRPLAKLWLTRWREFLETPPEDGFPTYRLLQPEIKSVIDYIDTRDEEVRQMKEALEWAIDDFRAIMQSPDVNSHGRNTICRLAIDKARAALKASDGG